MRLSLFGEKVKDVQFEDNAGDRRVPIQDGEHPTAPHRPQVLAEPRLEIPDSNLVHDQIIVMSGHVVDM